VKWSKDEIAILEMENLRGPEVELANYGRVRGMANGMKKYEASCWRCAAVRRSAARGAGVRAREGTGGGAASLATLRKLNAERRKTEERDTVISWLGRSSPMLARR